MNCNRVTNRNKLFVSFVRSFVKIIRPRPSHASPLFCTGRVRHQPPRQKQDQLDTSRAVWFGAQIKSSRSHEYKRGLDRRRRRQLVHRQTATARRLTRESAAEYWRE